ncbi:MAG TPA: nuclear transport factor 2 family protein [Gaiellaceae bacterium]|nr:nuclear transport factor 2 family protein [Gaiellaceae bacterium]
MSANVDLVRKTYEAFARGDIDTVLAGFAEDIEWIEPAGYFAGAGGVRGRAAVAEVFGEYPKFWSELSVTPDRFLEAGDEWVIVTGDQRGIARETGNEYRGRVCNVWQIRDGQAVRLEVFTDTGLMWKAFGRLPPDAERA